MSKLGPSKKDKYYFPAVILSVLTGAGIVISGVSILVLVLSWPWVSLVLVRRGRRRLSAPRP